MLGCKDYSVTWENTSKTICLSQSATAVGPLLLNGTEVKDYAFERSIIVTTTGLSGSVRLRIKGVSLGVTIEETMVMVSSSAFTSTYTYSSILSISIVTAGTAGTMTVDFSVGGRFRYFQIEPSFSSNIAVSLNYPGVTAPTATPVMSLSQENTRVVSGDPMATFPLGDISKLLTFKVMPYKYFTLEVGAGNAVNTMTLNIYQRRSAQ